jgi:hypothetical protein
MEDLVVLILIAVIVFLFWKSSQPAAYAVDDVMKVAPVQTDIVQAIIEGVQAMKPNLAPIDTVFVNPQADGTHASRILFYNTKQFFGTQYDITSKVNSNGSVNILNIAESASVEPSYGYKPDAYKSWSDVTTNLGTRLAGALQGYTNNPPQPNLLSIPDAYQQNMITTQTNLMTRS